MGYSGFRGLIEKIMKNGFKDNTKGEEYRDASPLY